MTSILPALFRQPQGYLVTNDPDPTKSRGQSAIVESSTITCRHCGTIVVVPPMCKPEATPYAMCWGCRGNICLPCDEIRVRTLKCDVIENKLERAEAQDRFRRDITG